MAQNPVPLMLGLDFINGLLGLTTYAELQLLDLLEAKRQRNRFPNLNANFPSCHTYKVWLIIISASRRGCSSLVII
jgi:hypothetical protein